MLRFYLAISGVKLPSPRWTDLLEHVELLHLLGLRLGRLELLTLLLRDLVSPQPILLFGKAHTSTYTNHLRGIVRIQLVLPLKKS